MFKSYYFGLFIIITVFELMPVCFQHIVLECLGELWMLWNNKRVMRLREGGGLRALKLVG